MKQKYLAELSKLNPSPSKYVLEQNKALVKAQWTRFHSQMSTTDWAMVAAVTGGIVVGGGALAVVACTGDNADCSFE